MKRQIWAKIIKAKDEHKSFFKGWWRSLKVEHHSVQHFNFALEEVSFIAPAHLFLLPGLLEKRASERERRKKHYVSSTILLLFSLVSRNYVLLHIDVLIIIIMWHFILQIFCYPYRTSLIFMCIKHCKSYCVNYSSIFLFFFTVVVLNDVCWLLKLYLPLLCMHIEAFLWMGMFINYGEGNRIRMRLVLINLMKVLCTEKLLTNFLSFIR